MGNPTKTSRGLWVNTRAAIYDIQPERITLGYLFDRTSGQLRQTQILPQYKCSSCQKAAINQRKGRETKIQQERWNDGTMETILAHAQGLVYTLLNFMPSPYQRDSLQAILGLFLQAQGHPLPQQSQAKSASALSRFLNIYPWSTRQLIRATRQIVLQQVLSQRRKGRRPMLQVIIDLTTKRKTRQIQSTERANTDIS